VDRCVIELLKLYSVQELKSIQLLPDELLAKCEVFDLWNSLKDTKE